MLCYCLVDRPSTPRNRTTGDILFTVCKITRSSQLQEEVIENTCSLFGNATWSMYSGRWVYFKRRGLPTRCHDFIENMPPLRIYVLSTEERDPGRNRKENGAPSSAGICFR